MMQRPKKRETIVPPKKPYTKDQFFKSTVLQLKGMSGGVDRNYVRNNIIERANRLSNQGVSKKEIVGIIKKAKTAHGDWLRNYRTRERRKYFSK
jgi:hypothetical protein|tara:strand:+ start:1314 stop:1595 length:282 start_codon:yes stop_codon:yes gene_type:complete